MSGDLRPAAHLRPHFPTAAHFAADTAPHFQFLVDEFGYSGPTVSEEPGAAYDVRFDGPATAVVLSWEVDGEQFGCELAPRLESGDLDPDYEHWLSANELLGAHDATDDWVVQADLDGVDEAGYAAVMEHQADNLRRYCADVLRGEWRVRAAAQRWLGAGDA